MPIYTPVGGPNPNGYGPNVIITAIGSALDCGCGCGIDICCEDGLTTLNTLPTGLIVRFTEVEGSFCGCTFSRTEVPITYNASSPDNEPRWDSNSDAITDCGGLEIAPIRFGNDVGGCIFFLIVRIVTGLPDNWSEFSKSCDPFEVVFQSPDGCLRATVSLT
jgi:hypothetical protein